MTESIMLSVRSYELDAYGHVNNATYLNYLEYARLEFLKATGFPYAEFRELGYGLVVARIDIRYRRPAFLGDELKIVTTSISRGRMKGSLEQKILKGDEVIIQAMVDYATVDSNGRPAPIPEELQGRWPLEA